MQIHMGEDAIVVVCGGGVRWVEKEMKRDFPGPDKVTAFMLKKSHFSQKAEGAKITQSELD